MSKRRSSVSVVIPCYNLGAYLPEAVESVRQQSRQPDELIIVDDGSTDEPTRQCLLRYAQEGITVYQKPNGGASSARNHGIRRTQSDYILCLDADDILQPTYLEATVAEMDRLPAVGIVATQIEFFGDSTGIWQPQAYTPHALLWQNQISGGSLFRRVCWQQAGGYKELKGCEDWELWLSIIAEHGWQWAVVAEPLYRYRQRPSSISSYVNAHRAELLPQIVQLHAPLYHQHLADLLVAMDADFTRLREQRQQLNRKQQAQAEQIARLQQTLQLSIEKSLAYVAPQAAIARRTPDNANTASWLIPVGPAIEHHTFSVVIATYKRAAFLGQAIESVFQQDYPKDSYELIVIDNDSPDETADVVRRAFTNAPIPCHYYIEPRNGLSYARNLGIAKARFEFVAQLDDDAIANPAWLAAFNRVIKEQHALVVGGRVEKTFAAGCTPPAWFNYPYLLHFFGVNYRDRGKLEKVFRIRYPLYLSGGNTAYAKRLFDHFGGFQPYLGRNGKSLLSGEEDLLNLTLDRHDIPMYYADDAYIHHYVGPERLNKPHLGKKALWAGISNALVQPAFFGAAAVRQRTGENWTDLWRKVYQVLTKPGDAENFSRLCRALYHLAFLYTFYLNYLKAKVRGPQPAQPTIPWTTHHWINEILRWPEGADRYEQLYHLYLTVGDVEKAQTALERLALEQAPADAAPRANWTQPAGPLGRTQYEQLLVRIRQAVAHVAPHNSKVVVVSKGDDALLKLDGRQGWHFPQDSRGKYAGYYPADSTAAITHLEELRSKGATYLVLPSTALWWLDHYREFGQYLMQHYQTVVQQKDTGLIFALHRPAPAPTGALSTRSEVYSRPLG